MKIDIKNIKINKAFSEETICFTADIFVNGGKIGHARNDGHGGSTDYYSYHKPNDDENLRQAEAFAKTLPSSSHTFDDTTIVIESTLEGIIDKAIDDNFNNKEKASQEKAKIKKMETHICYGIPNNETYHLIGFQGSPKFIELAKTPQGRVAMVKLYERIKSELKEGEVIFNTNLELNTL